MYCYCGTDMLQIVYNHNLIFQNLCRFIQSSFGKSTDTLAYQNNCFICRSKTKISKIFHFINSLQLVDRPLLGYKLRKFFKKSGNAEKKSENKNRT